MKKAALALLLIFFHRGTKIQYSGLDFGLGPSSPNPIIPILAQMSQGFPIWKVNLRLNAQSLHYYIVNFIINKKNSFSYINYLCYFKFNPTWDTCIILENWKIPISWSATMRFWVFLKQCIEKNLNFTPQWVQYLIFRLGW